MNDLFEQYQSSPTEEIKIKLKNANEKVPKHYRAFILGKMGTKDYPIREIIYGRAD